MPGTLQLVQVTKSPSRIQTWMVDNDMFLLVNPDIINPIYIGNDPGQQLIAVPPLGSMTLGADKHDIWVSTSGGVYVVNAYLMPNGSNWTPSPAQVAAQINALGLAKDTTLQTTNTISGNTNTILGTPAQTTDINGVVTTLGAPSQSADVTGLSVNGVPLLRGTTQLGNASGQTLAALTTITLLNASAINKPGFEAVFKLNLPAGVGTTPFAILVIGWQDAVTGLQVGIKQYVLTAGNGPTQFCTFYISGPCRGNQLQLQLRNMDGAQPLTYSWLFNTTSHIYATDRLLQPTYPGTGPNGYTFPAGNPSKGVLFVSNPSLAPNTSLDRLCAASNAKVKVSIDNGTPNANVAALAFLTPNVTTLYDEVTVNQSLFKVTAAAGGSSFVEWQCPNGPFIVRMFNTAATNTISPQFVILAEDY